MFRLATFVALQMALITVALEPTLAGEYGTADEAKAMLERAVAAVKEDKAKALDAFNKGEGGFKDRDLYVFCANAFDGILTAHPFLKGEQSARHQGQEGLSARARDYAERCRGDDKRNLPTGGLAPAPTSRSRRHTFFTKVGDQDCGVGYYKQ